MSKLSKKLILRITVVLGIVIVLSIVINSFFLPKYFLYQKKNKLEDLTSQLATLEFSQLLKQSELMEEEYEVTIVSASLRDTTDELNSHLMEQLNRKDITLSKFWLTDESIAKLREGGKINKIYDQTKLKSRYLVNFLPIEGYVFAIGESISHSSDTIRIVNQFNAYIWIGALLLLILLSASFVTRIVKPIAKLNETAEGISKLSFTKVDIRTGDEIESLAQSINKMSDKLKDAHHNLEQKNENLKTFIADISHELKTPLSLIQVYASGIKDGLDDGTYPDVIKQQSEAMANMINRLLELSRLQAESYTFVPINFALLLEETLESYQTAFRQQGIELEVEYDKPTKSWVMADYVKLQSVLHNFLTNAMKYTTDNRVRLLLVTKEETVDFRISNGADTEDKDKWERVWEPFFVMESSRSKKFSGTGLGLSITRTILENHQATYGLQVQEGMVEFYFSLALLRR
ncbi:HAMP domain-containing histidine kinase [Paenibacillus sp. GSMTC-2017]|uniref:sensor histidine kinase n=1 Tax=Paenibacillus sp. GSMTC-2017 TaxID=2794350 RepID=UPI0018DA1075|nr:HAMP domain-containing sensor histidine kinase [Paenibacillus sp. GSMTC-2017]MBH5317829.1 HAMP domain-containing histidine kinase [Paenibacillus sp. GSMTC-2017]